MTIERESEDGLSPVLIALMKGVVYRESDTPLWQTLLQLQARVHDYFAHIGLELMLDEAEGYAFLRQRRADDAESKIPRLIPRRQLSYPVSLLLVLLRKKLAEFDAGDNAERLILEHTHIVDLMRLFLPETVNEAREIERIERYIEKIVELGFLRRLRGSESLYEVRRVLKAFVDAQCLGELAAYLAEYREHAERPASAAEELQ